MKKVSVILLVLGMVLLLGVSVTFATPYFSGNLGAVWVDDSDAKNDIGAEAEFSFDAGFGLTVAFGSAYDNGARAEVELGYRNNDLDEFSEPGFSESIDGDVSTLSLMVNGFYDFIPNGTVSPFVGGGIGIANVEGDIEGFGSEDDTVLAYQVAAGVSFAVSHHTKIDMQYRFFGTDDPDFDTFEAEYTTHNLMIGLRQSF
jgi:opacity protein-like surface antigen